MLEEDIKVRAYYFYKDSFGNDADHRYYMAKEMTNRLQKEKCNELNSDTICCFCHSRYGCIQTPYLLNDTLVCYQCYIMNNKDSLINIYDNSYLILPKNDKIKREEKECRSILKKNLNDEEIIEEIENDEDNQFHYTNTENVEFNMMQTSYNAFHNYFFK
jgi:hypothetical protein